jgi:hypothetical protein
MTSRATDRKIKRSFTLTPESVAFLTEVRKKRRIASDSEALDLLLQESRLMRKDQEIEAAVRRYYDEAGEEELREESQWAEMAAPSLLLSSEHDELEP